MKQHISMMLCAQWYGHAERMGAEPLPGVVSASTQVQASGIVDKGWKDKDIQRRKIKCINEPTGTGRFSSTLQ